MQVPNVPLKIAVYSGGVPSTTFIERLIAGLATNGTIVYIFGVQHKRLKRKTSIYLYTYRDTRLGKLFQLFKYSFLLRIFKLQDKKRLDAIILSKKKNRRLLKVKYYPVLYHRPDIFHLQWAKGLEDWSWVRLFGIKLVVSLRGAHINYSPIANASLAMTYRTLFPEVDRFHAVSKAIALEGFKYNAALSNTEVIYSGVPLEELSFCAKNYMDRTLSIISVGRSHWKKGYSHALDAMALLKGENVDFDYTIVGVDEDEALLFQRSQLKLESEVQFLGPLPFEIVKGKIREADVLLLSSVEEGIANVVLEAMAMGTLVVSTDCGGMKEVVSDGVNGFLVPIREPESMASLLNKISKLLLEDYQSLTIAARKAIEQQHDMDMMVTDMKRLYEKVLNKTSN